MDIGVIKNVNIVNGYSKTITIRAGNPNMVGAVSELIISNSLKLDGADAAVIAGDRAFIKNIIEVSGSFEWKHGQFSKLQVNLGKLAVGAQPAVPCATTIDGADKTISNATLVYNVLGTVTWKGGNITASDQSSFTNGWPMSTATFDIQSNATFDGVFTNRVGATLIKSSGAGTTLFKQGLTNEGTFSLGTGTIQVDGNLTQTKGSTILAGGVLKAAKFSLADGFLLGSGSIIGNVVNSGGIVSPLFGGVPGNIIITGDYTQTNRGELLIRITATGTTATLAAQAAANGTGGTISLAGQVSVMKDQNYKPATATLQFLSATSPFVGDFGQKLLGFSWTVDAKDYEFKASMTADTKAYQLTVIESPKKNSSIGGDVFANVDGSGQYDPVSSPPIANVTVQLWTANASGNPLVLQDSTTTDADGLYGFTEVAEGTYVVKVLKPMDWYLDPLNPGNSDVDPTTGLSELITLTSEEAEVVNAGMYQYGSIVGQVWDDADHDGIINNGETAMEDVVINLLDNQENVVTSATTGANGDYSFSNLTPGEYQLQIVVPAGHSLAERFQGEDLALDSDFDPATNRTAILQVFSGSTVSNENAGLTANGAISGRIWIDGDVDGVRDYGESVMANVTLIVINEHGEIAATTTTDTNGDYAFADLTPGVYQMFIHMPNGYGLTDDLQGADPTIDSDFDPSTNRTALIDVISSEAIENQDGGLVAFQTVSGRAWDDVNANGLQDEGELSKAGVAIDLFDDTGFVIGSAVTDANGNYSIQGTVLGRSYQLGVDVPTDTALTLKDAGTDDTIDSDFDPVSALSDLFVIVTQQPILHLDAGLREATAAVSGRAWHDEDEDGIQGTGEAGFAGIEVRLIDSVTLITIAITTTDSNGNYSFDDVPAGSYYIEFVPPTGYVFTPQNAGSDDDLDSDVNPATNKTAVFELDDLEEIDNIDAGLDTTDAS